MLWQAPMDLVDIPNSELLVINNEHLIYSGEEGTANRHFSR